MSVDKTHLVTILELDNPEKIFNTLDKKYSTMNAAGLAKSSEIVHEVHAIPI